MHCIHCGSEDTSVFFVERIPCSHCKETTELIYEACNECHLMWKSVDGVVLNNSFDVMDSLDNVEIDGIVTEEDLMRMPTEEELEEMLDEFEALIVDSNVPQVSSMQDMIHKCLRCNAVSYEIKPQYYHCPECGFEWEVL